MTASPETASGSSPNGSDSFPMPDSPIGILSAIPAHVAVVDATGVILVVNEAWKRFASANVLRSEDFLVGHNYLAVCERATDDCTDDAANAAAGIRAVLEGRLSEFTLEYPCHSPTEDRWFRLMVTPLYEGQQRGAVVMHVDVTARKADELALRRAERLSRESEERLGFALEAARIGDWDMDLRTNVARRSLRHDQCFGYETAVAEWGYDTFLAHVDSDDRSRVDASFQQAMSGEGEYDVEFRCVWPDGNTHWLWTKGRFFFDETEEPYRVAGIVVDITTRKDAEAAIDHTVQRLMEAQRIGRIGDWEWDRLSGKITWSPEVFEIVGRDPHLGTPATFEEQLELYDEPSQQRTREKIQLACASGLAQEYELGALRPDGEHVHLLARAVPRLDVSGGVVGLYGTIQDISDRKRLERQFLRAQRLESIGTLAGGIAHDLNNVLSPIMLSIELLRMSYPDSADQELLDSIERSAQHGADLVRQVLSFARGVEGDRLEVRVNQLVWDVEQTARDTFLKSINVRTSVPADLWRVVGDPTQLQQVLVNLCVNARDAMPDGGKLTITAENVTLDANDAAPHLDASAGPYVLIRVEDSGTGIAQEDIERIFDPFFTTKEVGKGTGLGLSTTLAIVKSHGGFVRVYSEPGNGSRFNVYLPARTSFSHEETDRAVKLPRGQGELILVVDDEPSVRQITQKTLEAFGYRTVVAADGADALAIYARRGNEISVVITDMMMPVMDGASTIRVLHKLNPSVRIIAASGLVNNGNVTSAGLGVRHFLPKPYTADTLLTVLRQCLDDQTQ